MLGEMGDWAGAAEKIALRLVAVLGPQEGELGRGLDALRQDRQAQPSLSPAPPA